MEHYLQTVWTSVHQSWWHVLWVSGLCMMLELLWPASNVTLRSRVRGALFWAVYIVITDFFLSAFKPWFASLHIKPLFTLGLQPISQSPHLALRVLGWLAVPLIAGAVGEFFYYWFHRAQHTWGWLWRFHAVHHSLEEMSAFNSNHHVSEHLLRIPFIVVPMALLIGVNTGPIVFAMVILMQMQGQFEHACTRFNFGPFRYLIADNRYHRIHHSVEQQHWDHNYGSFMPFWDIVFGTALFPKKGEWPAVGIPGAQEPSNVRDFLFMPFKRYNRANPVIQNASSN